ncbi:MAG: lysostaphin resistance A-like protein [Limisphaerales bacterium]
MSAAPLPRWRSGVALVLLGFYVMLPAVLGLSHEGTDQAILPATVRGVLILCAVELGLFGVAFGVSTWLAHLRAPELYLTTRIRWWTWPRALGWSLALRIGVGVLLAGTLGLAQLIRGEPISSLDGLRPKIEAMVDIEALKDPVYLALMLTMVSFVLAGLREELWRAGMIALLGRLAPGWFGGRWGPWFALAPVALLFGLGHTAQGWVGVAATTGLGLGLGAIMVWHRSLWDAVLAHGFFNATTFALLPILARLIPQLTQQPTP